MSTSHLAELREQFSRYSTATQYMSVVCLLMTYQVK